MCKEAPYKLSTLYLLKTPYEIQKEKLLIIINKNHKINNSTGSNFKDRSSLSDAAQYIFVLSQLAGAASIH